MRKIKQYTTHLLMTTQNGGQEQSVSPGNVHEGLDSFDVVCFRCRVRLHSADWCHRSVEDRGDLWASREILENRRFKDMIESWQARLHAVAELPPRPPRDVMSGKARVPGKALGMVDPKQLSQGRESESAISALSEQAHARESPQQSVEPVV